MSGIKDEGKGAATEKAPFAPEPGARWVGRNTGNESERAKRARTAPDRGRRNAGRRMGAGVYAGAWNHVAAECDSALRGLGLNFAAGGNLN